MMSQPVSSTTITSTSVSLPSDFWELFAHVNVACQDDGNSFLVPHRLLAIQSLLADSAYRCLHHKLAYLYIHRDFNKDMPYLLLSVHIDALYPRYFFEESADGCWLGTFDNSLCDAICVHLLREGILPSNVLVAFTGNEEGASRGVDHCIKLLKNQGLFASLECVAVLDVTPEAFGEAHLCIENLFFQSRSHKHSRLRFKKIDQWRQYLATMALSIPSIAWNRKAAEPDESWQYDKHNLHCASWCLPCAPHPARIDDPDWMHSEAGIRVQKSAVEGYVQALVALCSNIASHLSHHNT